MQYTCFSYRYQLKLVTQIDYVVHKGGLNVVRPNKLILIEKGSVMGFYCRSKNVIPYTENYCASKQTLFRTTPRIGLYKEGHVLSFRKTTKCRNYSLKMKLIVAEQNRE